MTHVDELLTDHPWWLDSHLRITLYVTHCNISKHARCVDYRNVSTGIPKKFFVKNSIKLKTQVENLAHIYPESYARKG